ncbi:polysaccharide biosynthesis/export family protein [Ponticaulis sp.]|uniref:polysaccharide biosynthesis/export family protein n=1 Tax=Ponticaulis sp. TaxID=2020902 RepID=UPI0025FEF49B|nr:polysaccharide biosynthesis/export family protein [Ponticaulis sp.]
MRRLAPLILGSILGACATNGDPPVTTNGVVGFQPYSPSLPNYRVFPGDVLDISIYSAPELSRTVIVGPDGRIQMPMLAPVMVANRTIPEINQILYREMSARLVDPTLDVVVSEFGPQRIFVGGQVNQPGVIEIDGQIDALQAVIMAGGFNDSARERQVILVRRSPEGEISSYSLDVRAGWHNPELAQLGPLQRFDVIYVPRSRIAQHNLFIQQYIRGALPIDFSLYYDVLGDSRN